MNLGAEWRGFDLSVFFQGVAKRDYWLDGMIFWGVAGDAWGSTGYEEHWNFFRPEGDPLGANTNAYYPRPIWSSNQNRQVQSGFLQNAAYIRLKNLQIGYTLPKKWLSKTPLRSVKVSIVGRDLFNIYKAAPVNAEFALNSQDVFQAFELAALPSTRNIGFSLNVKF